MKIRRYEKNCAVNAMNRATIASSKLRDRILDDAAYWMVAAVCGWA